MGRKTPASLVQRWKEEGLRSNQEKYYNGGTIHSRMSKIESNSRGNNYTTHTASVHSKKLMIVSKRQ